MDQLEAVNRILRSGQVKPVASIPASPDRQVAKAIAFLDQERLRIAEMGWHENKEVDYELVPVAGEIAKPSGVLSIVVPFRNSGGDRICIRDDKLYNLTKHSDNEFTSNLKATVIFDIAFEDMTPAMQEYVVCSACVKFAAQSTCDRAVRASLDEDAKAARGRLRLFDTQQHQSNLRNQYPLNRISAKWPEID